MMSAPRSWKVVTLGEVAETALGKMLDKGRPKGYPHVPYLRNVNVQWGRIDTDNVLTMELAHDERERFAVVRGDLLVCEGGEAGRAAIWERDHTYIAYQKALHRIRPSDRLDSRFLRYYLEHAATIGALNPLTTGSTIKHLSQQNLRRLPLWLPPIDEQRHIVEILEDHLSRLDAADAALARTAKRADALVARVMFDCYTSPIASLGAESEIQGGIQKQPSRTPATNAFPFLRVANVTAGGLDLTDVHQIELFPGEIDKYRLAAGDLLVVEGNGSPSQIGRAALWDGSIPECVHQNHLIRVRPRDGLLPEFLEVIWNSPQNRATLTELSSSSSGLHTLSVGKLKSLSIPLPPPPEQRRAVSSVSSARDAAARAQDAIRLALRRSTSLRRALLAAAFEGRLTGRPSDLDLAAETTEL